MLALYQILRRNGHIITQIIETEFIVGTKSNICHIRTTTSFRVRLMLIDTIYAQAMEHIKRTHPFRVTFCQIIVDSYYVYAITRQGIQEHRKRCYQSLTFTGCHFRNLTLMQHHTTKQLYIVMYHVPGHFVSTCFPMVLPDSLVTFNTNEVTSLCSKFTVKITGSHFQFFIF